MIPILQKKLRALKLRNLSKGIKEELKFETKLTLFQNY